MASKSKSQHLSIGGPPDFQFIISKENEGETLSTCEQLKDLVKMMNTAFNFSWNIITFAIEALKVDSDVDTTAFMTKAGLGSCYLLNFSFKRRKRIQLPLYWVHI